MLSLSVWWLWILWIKGWPCTILMNNQKKRVLSWYSALPWHTVHLRKPDHTMLQSIRAAQHLLLRRLFPSCTGTFLSSLLPMSSSPPPSAASCLQSHIKHSLHSNWLPMSPCDIIPSLRATVTSSGTSILNPLNHMISMQSKYNTEYIKIFLC